MFLNEAKVGEYVKIIDNVELTFYLQSSQTGWGETQKYNPSKILWRVLRRSDELGYERIELVSAESVMKLSLAGEIGYEFAEQTLMEIIECSAFNRFAKFGVGENECAIRSFGAYADWKLQGDKSYYSDSCTFDYKLMLEDIKYLMENNLLPDAEWIWIPVTNFFKYGDTTLYNVRAFDAKRGVVNVKTLYSVNNEGIKKIDSHTCDVITIITIPSNVKVVAGDGSIKNPYKFE